MTLASEVGPVARRPGRYHLAIGETDSCCGVREFEWIGTLEDIKAFALDLLLKVRHAERVQPAATARQDG